MKAHLENILWNLIDSNASMDNCCKALPDDVSMEDVNHIIGFSGMMLSVPLLEAAVKKYALTRTEFHIDTQYQGKTPIEWIKNRAEKGDPTALSMLSIIRQLSSFEVSKDKPIVETLCSRPGNSR